MASLLGGGSTGEGGNAPQAQYMSISIRKTWAVSGLLSSERVGSTDDEIRLTTWVSFSKGRMGSTGGKGLTDWVSLSNGRVGSPRMGSSRPLCLHSLTREWDRSRMESNQPLCQQVRLGCDQIEYMIKQID
jgi:hypothetical protein